jgi:hypothetical protein
MRVMNVSANTFVIPATNHLEIHLTSKCERKLGNTEITWVFDYKFVQRNDKHISKLS